MNRRDALRSLCGGGTLAIVPDPGWRLSGNAAQPFDLEIIVSSLQDAIAAYEGGASRLEVTTHLDQGGLTPPLSVVESILRRVSIPARIMLRQHSGFAIAGDAEIEKLNVQAEDLAKLPIDGLITGFVRAGGLDLTALRQIAGAVPSVHLTVHNAIESTSDPLAALRSLRSFPSVDAALVTGGMGSLPERMARLPAYVEALGPNRRVVLGGLHLKDLTEVRGLTNIRSFHLGVGVRTAENPLGEVDLEKVKEARRLLLSTTPALNAPPLLI